MNRLSSFLNPPRANARNLPGFLGSVSATTSQMPPPRFEFKYRVTESTADLVRDYVGSFLEVDHYASGSANNSYPVNSCYLDSHDLQTFWHTVNGARDRYKLRVRTYDDRPESPVFFEIKRRVHGRIIKHRGAVRRTSVDALPGGQMPQSEDLAAPGHEHFLAVERFVRLRREIDASPTAYVRYQREAWVGPGQSADRVTMDREVLVWPTSAVRLSADAMTEPARPFGGIVVLEMKFTGQQPEWLRDLEQLAGLQRVSAAKYCDGILKHGVDEFTAVNNVPADPLFAERADSRRRRTEGLLLPLPAFA